MLEFRDGSGQFLAVNTAGGETMKPYPQVEGLVAPALRVRMPRAPWVVAPAGAQYRILFAPSADPQADARDAR